MNLTTILLIAIPIGLMVVMHTVGHGGHMRSGASHEGEQDQLGEARSADSAWSTCGGPGDQQSHRNSAAALLQRSRRWSDAWGCDDALDPKTTSVANGLLSRNCGFGAPRWSLHPLPRADNCPPASTARRVTDGEPASLSAHPGMSTDDLRDAWHAGGYNRSAGTLVMPNVAMHVLPTPRARALRRSPNA
jgi:hypothetical protein